MSDSTRIRFEHVTKDFKTESIASVGLKNLILSLPRHLGQPRSPKTFRALSDISFSVERGQCLGVIGRNGSGKSTTLGLIAGVIRATQGKVAAFGHICPLLELGAGFHPELSGAENIFLNGVLLGMTRRQVRAKFAEIVEFSELEEFLERPLRTYSTGMMARLGFAVAIHLEPEILLVDEILAVGDIQFQQKCIKRMEEFRGRGVTIVFVSHSPGAVQSLCDHALWLEHGQVRAFGDAATVCGQYQTAATAPP